jgi:hypothetical protein
MCGIFIDARGMVGQATCVQITGQRGWAYELILYKVTAPRIDVETRAQEFEKKRVQGKEF